MIDFGSNGGYGDDGVPSNGYAMPANNNGHRRSQLPDGVRQQQPPRRLGQVALVAGDPVSISLNPASSPSGGTQGTAPVVSSPTAPTAESTYVAPTVVQMEPMPIYTPPAYEQPVYQQPVLSQPGYAEPAPQIQPPHAPPPPQQQPPWQPPPPPPPPIPPSGTEAYASAASAALVANGTSPYQQPAGVTTNTGTPLAKDKTMLYLGLGAAALAAVGIWFFIAAKKRKKET